jgi:hypothetical protein
MKSSADFTDFRRLFRSLIGFSGGLTTAEPVATPLCGVSTQISDGPQDRIYNLTRSD